MRGGQGIGQRFGALLVAGMVASVAAGCSADDGPVFRVVGAGSACDAEQCPPGVTTYSLRLAAADEAPADARSFDLAEDAPHRESVGEYPECVRARIDGDEIDTWTTASCP